MKVSPENFVKVTVMAILGIAIARVLSSKFGITGLDQLLG